MIYCREAHPIDGERPDDRVLVEDPITTAERLAVAKNFVTTLKIEIPTLLDKLDDAVAHAYASHPDRLYLVGKDGTIAYASGKGPDGFKLDELKEAILEETGE